MGIGNEYEKVLKYLLSQDVKPSAGKSKVRPPKKKAESKKQKASTDTKKLLEESTIDEYIDIPSVQFKKNLPSKGFNIKQFETLMRSKLIEEYKTRQSYERPYISCSELYNCMRQIYYSRMRYQINIADLFRFSYLYLIQKIGNHIHDIFQDLYNFTEVEKTVVSEKYKVKGRVDAIQGKNLYEIKSIDPPKFKGKYIREHYLQAIIYAFILITEYGYEIENITIIYVIRDLKKIHVFDLDVDMKLAQSLLERAPVLQSALKANAVPDPIGATKEQCKYCLYKKYCEKDAYNKIIPPYMRKEKKQDKEAVFLL